MKQGFDASVMSYIGFQIFGQVINRVGNITGFDYKQGKGFGKWAAHTHPIFLGVPSPGNDKMTVYCCLPVHCKLLHVSCVLYFFLHIKFRVQRCSLIISICFFPKGKCGTVT